MKIDGNRIVKVLADTSISHMTHTGEKQVSVVCIGKNIRCMIDVPYNEV